MNPETVAIAARPQQDLLSKISRRVTPWLRTRTARIDAQPPIISFTFDDIPDTALRNGARVLEHYGARGTFYVAGGLCGKRYGDWVFAAREELPGLFEMGHEIGCHTFSHFDVQTLARDRLASDLDANTEFFEALIPDLELNNFAYPYGSVAIPQKRMVQRRFRSARGVRQGINRNSVDLGQVMAFRLYDTLLDADAIERLVAETVSVRGWLVFYTHDVDEQPTSQGCTPRLLATALQAAKRHGCDCLTIDAALDRLAAAAGTRI